MVHFGNEDGATAGIGLMQRHPGNEEGATTGIVLIHGSLW